MSEENNTPKSKDQDTTMQLKILRGKHYKQRGQKGAFGKSKGRHKPYKK